MEDQAPPFRDPGMIDLIGRRSITEEELAEHRGSVVQMVPGSRLRKVSKCKYDHHYKEISEYGHDTNMGDVESASHQVARILNNEELSHIHAPPVFSEMAELQENKGQVEWREIARWLRFEEHVEQGGKRWSKPYVATLPLHSVFETRGCLVTGAVLLDVGANTLDELAELLVDHLVNAGQLEEDFKTKVKEILLYKHHHLKEQRLEEQDDDETCGVTNCISRRKKFKAGGKIGGVYAQPQSSLHNNAFFFAQNESKTHEPLLKGNQNFLRKMPEGVEAANLLIAEQPFLSKPLMAFVRLKHGVQMGDMTEVTIPTRFLFLLIGPEGHLQTFRDVGRTIGAMMSDEVFREVAYKARSRNDILAGVDEFIDAVTVLPPAEWDPKIRIEPPEKIPPQEQRRKPSYVPEEVDSEEEEEIRRRDMGLVRTGRLFGGLIDDVRRKLPWYWSDFKDAFSIQSIAAILFLYFATLSPIITFGGLLDMATGGNIAVIESLVSAFISGVIYGFFSGQPLSILNTTGPVLVFEGITYIFCQEYHLNFLEFRLWIGIWTFVLMFILVAFECSAYVCYITRFTEENFALLIAMVYIHQAIEKMWLIGREMPMQMHTNRLIQNNETVGCLELAETSNWTDDSNWTQWSNDTAVDINNNTIGSPCPSKKYVPDVLLMSVIEFLGTFALVLFLKAFRNMPFFPFKVRQFLSDFAVVIAIAGFTIFDDTMGLRTPKLYVPDSFTPTRSDRTWFVHPYLYNPWWTIIASILPAMLATILIFMDQMITAVIMNRKENLLKKGPGYHLDLLVLGFLILINSFVGVPWLVAGTVVAITHVNALKMESEVAAPGEKPQFLGVREQRVTQIMIFIMIGASVGMVGMLTYIPMPVLFGVFMYMGTSPLSDMHFVNRLLLFIMPVKYQPDYPYLRHIRLWRVHVFTLVQLFCMVALWIVKLNKTISISFPFMLVIMVGVRKCLDYFFTQEELKLLDDIMPGSRKRKHIEDGMKNKTTAEPSKSVDQNFLKVAFTKMSPNGDASHGQRYIVAGTSKNRGGKRDASSHCAGGDEAHHHLASVTQYIDDHHDHNPHHRRPSHDSKL